MFTFVFSLLFHVFIIDWLQHVVILSVSLFVGFRISNSDGKFISDRIIGSNHALQYAIDLES